MNAPVPIIAPTLHYSVIESGSSGPFLVVYPTPGCLSHHTVALECSSKESAEREADRLNRGQIEKEAAIQMDRKLRGFRSALI